MLFRSDRGQQDFQTVMREYLTLLPYTQEGILREVQIITPELDLIAKGLRQRKFCLDEDGATENSLRHGGVSFVIVKDCWLTAACTLRDADDEMNDSMNAELSADGRILLKADTLPELKTVCQARLVQHLATCPNVIQNAFGSGNPFTYLVPRVAALADPGDVPGWAGFKTWLTNVVNQSPTATVFPPALHPIVGRGLAQRFGAILAMRDQLRASAAGHVLRVAFDGVEALMLHAAIARLP